MAGLQAVLLEKAVVEVNLSHHGVLFLDELSEFNKIILENLRQPLEDGKVTISRAMMSLSYPARFMLAALHVLDFHLAATAAGGQREDLAQCELDVLLGRDAIAFG